MSVQVETKSATRAVCPHCQKLAGVVDHLLTPEYFKQGERTYGTWYCDECGGGYEIKVKSATDIEVYADPRGTKKIDVLILLYLDQPGTNLHIVLPHDKVVHPNETFEETVKQIKYWINEHTCPWNWLRLSIKVGEDCDPHGVFKVQEIVMRPDWFTDSMSHRDPNGDYDIVDTWIETFPSLKNQLTPDRDENELIH